MSADLPVYHEMMNAAADVLSQDLPKGLVKGVIVIVFEADTFGYAVRGEGQEELAASLRMVANLLESEESR